MIYVWMIHQYFNVVFWWKYWKGSITYLSYLTCINLGGQMPIHSFSEGQGEIFSRTGPKKILMQQPLISGNLCIQIKNFHPQEKFPNKLIGLKLLETRYNTIVNTFDRGYISRIDFKYLNLLRCNRDEFW